MSGIFLPDGTEIKFGCNQPDVLKFAAAPAWDEANPVLSEAECADTDLMTQFLSPVKTQHFNNCTDASLAGATEALMRAMGFEDVPELSMSFGYMLHNGGNDSGAFCRDLADDLRKRGKPRASLCPENLIASQRSAHPQFAQEVLDDAKTRVALEIHQCLEWAHVRSALARGFIVYHGFLLGQAFFNVGPDGRVPSFDGRFSNGHAMFSYGLTRRFGSLRTMTRNSWGKSFGDNGTGYLDESYFWAQKGSFVNLDAFAVRAMKRTDAGSLPAVTE